jgi:hypothetical protein
MLILGITNVFDIVNRCYFCTTAVKYKAGSRQESAVTLIKA